MTNREPLITLGSVVVPVLGGTVFLGLIGAWLTSSLWLFTSKGWHF
jgi:hypothetical protein